MGKYIFENKTKHLSAEIYRITTPYYCTIIVIMITEL